MEIQHLRYFYSVCLLRNFSKAADACFVTPQGISMAIRRLEEELHCKLFERAPKKDVILTDHARYLLPMALRVINILDSCEDYFQSGIGKDQQLAVMFTQGAVAEFARSPIDIFNAEYSHNVHLELMHGYDKQCESTLDSGQCEIALISGPLDKEKYTFEFLYSTQYGIVVHENHKLSKQKTVSVKDLDQVPLTALLNAQKTQQALMDAAEKEGATLNISKFVGHAVLTHQQANTEHDVGITTESASHRFAYPHAVFVPFDDPTLRWNLYIAKRKDAELSSAGAKMWELMLAHRYTMDN